MYLLCDKTVLFLNIHPNSFAFNDFSIPKIKTIILIVSLFIVTKEFKQLINGQRIYKYV